MKPFIFVRVLALFGQVLLWASMAGAADGPAASPTFPELEKLLKERKLDAALEVATQATRDYPASDRAFFLLGRTQFYREQDGAAQVALDKAIALNPALAEAWFFRGLLYKFGKQSEQARKAFARATELRADRADYWFELGSAEYDAEHDDAATAALEKSLSLDANNAAAWYERGVILNRKKQFAEAAALWEKAVALDPDLANAYWNLGIYHQVHGDAKLALANFSKVYARKPDDIDTVKKLIQAHYRLEQFDQADIYRSKLLAMITQSTDPAVHGLTEFCIDQFDVANGRIFVYEAVDKKAYLVYWYSFKLVNEKSDIIRKFNLEAIPSMKGKGSNFVLAADEGVTHTTFGIAFDALPPYPALKQLVIKANAGQLPVAPQAGGPGR